jgi:hypothetical protein
MSSFRRERLAVRRTIWSMIPLVALALCLAWPRPSWSQTVAPGSVPCGWPLQVTGHGLSNVANPDTDATYWVMPVDTSTWQAMIVTGQYPQSRFFSFTTYYDLQQTSPRVVGDIIDAQIAPDSGSSNPFSPGVGAGPHDYTVTLDSGESGSGNHLAWAPGQTTYVIYRIYVADHGLGSEAGAPLPALTLVDTSGNHHPLAQCSSATRIAAELKDLIAALKGGVTAQTCQMTTQSGAVTFTANSGAGGVFPNPVTRYYSARNLCLQQDKVIVVRGQAADFPDTFNGGSIYQPAFPGSIQLRYWSLCNNKEVTPGPVVACMADHATQLDQQGFYTYVISRGDAGGGGETPPSWLPPGVTWLPWGDPLIQSALVFRDMLPEPDFTLTGSYLPTGVYCDKDVLTSQGWQGCFATAGMTAP